MSPSLPGRIDPRHYCSKGRTLQGRLALRELKRLVPLLASLEGEAAFVLEFRKDADGRAVVRGSVQAEVQIACQRCLEPMTRVIDESVELALVESIDEAGTLPEHLDPLLVEGESLDPREILEDELILALPATPRHAEATCVAQSGTAGSAQSDEDTKRESPFAILSSLKRGDGHDKT